MLFSQGGQSSLGAGRTLQLGSQRDSDERTGLLMGPGIAGPSSQERPWSASGFRPFASATGLRTGSSTGAMTAAIVTGPKPRTALMPQQPQQQQQRPTSAPTKAPLSLAAALGYTQRPTSASQQQMALVPADSPSNFMMTQVSGHEGLGGLAPSGLRGQSKFAPTTRADPQPAPFGSQQQQQGLQAVQRRATMDGLMMRPGSAPADSSNTWHPAPSAGVAMLAGAGAAAAAQAAAPVVAPGGSQQTLGSVLAGEVELKKTNQTLEAIQSQVSALHDNHTALTSELATMGQHCQQLLSLGDSYNSIVGAIRALEEKITSHMEHVQELRTSAAEQHSLVLSELHTLSATAAQHQLLLQAERHTAVRVIHEAAVQTSPALLLRGAADPGRAGTARCVRRSAHAQRHSIVVHETYEEHYEEHYCEHDNNDNTNTHNNNDPCGRMDDNARQYYQGGTHVEQVPLQLTQPMPAAARGARAPLTIAAVAAAGAPGGRAPVATAQNKAHARGGECTGAGVPAAAAGSDSAAGGSADEGGWVQCKRRGSSSQPRGSQYAGTNTVAAIQPHKAPYTQPDAAPAPDKPPRKGAKVPASQLPATPAAAADAAPSQVPGTQGKGESKARAKKPVVNASALLPGGTSRQPWVLRGAGSQKPSGGRSLLQAKPSAARASQPAMQPQPHPSPATDTMTAPRGTTGQKRPNAALLPTTATQATQPTQATRPRGTRAAAAAAAKPATASKAPVQAATRGQAAADIGVGLGMGGTQGVRGVGTQQLGSLTAGGVSDDVGMSEKGVGGDVCVSEECSTPEVDDDELAKYVAECMGRHRSRRRRL